MSCPLVIALCPQRNRAAPPEGRGLCWLVVWLSFLEGEQVRLSSGMEDVTRNRHLRLREVVPPGLHSGRSEFPAVCRRLCPGRLASPGSSYGICAAFTYWDVGAVPPIRSSPPLFPRTEQWLLLTTGTRVLPRMKGGCFSSKRKPSSEPLPSSSTHGAPGRCFLAGPAERVG